MRKILITLTLTLLALTPQRVNALDTEDLLALVAMPLAVAAVSDMAGVPANDLVDVVSLLNQAEVPPREFIQVVRYVPVALVVSEPDPFPLFLRSRYNDGLRGEQLILSIQDRLRTYELGDLDLTVAAPRLVSYDADAIIPDIVRTRVSEYRTHPHGGPPGQIKKDRGLQTGAEVVHGEHPANKEIPIDQVIDRKIEQSRGTANRSRPPSHPEGGPPGLEKKQDAGKAKGHPSEKPKNAAKGGNHRGKP